MSNGAPAPPEKGRTLTAIRRRFAGVLASRAVRSIGILVGGTATAHGITALAMPISTRLYSPADFSAAAVFAALVTILSVSACLRFDVAIALPDTDDEAADLLVLAVLCAVAASVACAGALAAMPANWLALLGEPAVVPWLWLVPVGVLVGGIYLALQMWFVRRSGFRAIALSRIAQSGSAATAQVSLGIARQAPLGLIVGQLLNIGAGVFWLGASVLRREGSLLRQVTIARMAHAFSRHRRFPLYSTWEALANASAIQAPILLIAALSLGPEAGYLTLAIFLLQIPMALFGNAIGQVYLSEAPVAREEGRLASYTLNLLKALVRTAAAPMTFLAIVSPAVFGWVFGDAWTRAGVLVSWMVPWFLAQFVTSPLSTALHVVGRQRAAMGLQVGGLAFRLGGVLAAAAWLPARISEAYAATGFVFYAVYLGTVASAVGLTRLDLTGALRDGLPLASLGALAGGGVAAAFWIAAAL